MWHHQMQLDGGPNYEYQGAKRTKILKPSATRQYQTLDSLINLLYIALNVDIMF